MFTKGRQGDVIGMESTTELLEELSELVYICDPQTYDLLYINSAGKKVFGIDGTCGGKCYQTLQGLDEPCPFCTNSLLNHEDFYTWEFTNQLTKRHYLLKDKFIHYNGKDARIEIAFDMTGEVNEKIALKNSLEAESVTLECVRMLHSSSNVQGTVEEVIEKIGMFLEAERAYMFEIDGDVMNNTFEWCAPGIKAEIAELQGMDIALLDRWREYFDKHQCVIIKSLEQIREKSPDEYKVLKMQNIERIVAAPLELDGSLVGYIGVDNPPEDKIENISSLLDTLCYFIESALLKERDRALLKRLSYHDTLTGTLNRNALMRDFRPGADIFSKNVGVAYLDINGMKEINDRHGHAYGDSCLARVASQIFKVFPNENVYRVGGDEFVILCSYPEDVFLHKVRELRQQFSGKEEYSASIGYKWAPYCQDVQKLMLAADEIMYTDKRDFYRSRSFTRRYRHGNDDILGLTKPGVLQRQIANSRFIVRLQPKMSIETGKAIGAEALVRYLDESGKEVSPDQFIPVLEEARMIFHLDVFVFEKVCATLERWKREKRKLIPISVNFSRYSLVERDLAERLNVVRDSYGVFNHQITVEVTESVEEDDRYAFLGAVEKLRGRGFPISIDDFGVKNANLSLFAACDFDELKMDRSLIVGLGSNPKSRAIVQSTVDICRRIGVQLIAEGVETDKQAEILLGLGCDGAQGFLYSRPILIEEFENKYLA